MGGIVSQEEIVVEKVPSLGEGQPSTGQRARGYNVLPLVP